ncbi:MAG TPA: hypothetical protein VFG42_23610 [Baekduia sp.]|uniref:hypothetical protein n=1 Tax=Baekduia sp. TaxID=2600305 RepID=UPI002D765242|nr:hypothetical protein [Baekduia sp.]HET6509801.1 hypothetical protein [Baekduia sp.]
MSLEEHTLEDVGERCEECGAKLTEREVELALERGGPTLCSIHLADVVAEEEQDDDAQPDTAG